MSARYCRRVDDHGHGNCVGKLPKIKMDLIQIPWNYQCLPNTCCNPLSPYSTALEKKGKWKDG